MQRIKKWLRWPWFITFKRHHEILMSMVKTDTERQLEHNKELSMVRSTMMSRIERLQEQVKIAEDFARRSTEHWTRIRFERVDERYHINIVMDSLMMGCISPSRHDLAMLGKYMGMRVEDEIATSRFVKSAEMNRKEAATAAYRKAYGKLDDQADIRGTS